MKLIYIANARIPTEKAHGIQIMQMCEAFTNAGNEVELVLPQRLNYIKGDPFEYYGVERNFKIKKLPCLDLIPLDIYLGKLSLWIQAISFNFFVFPYLLLKKADIIYTRDKFLLPLCLLKKNIVYEAHDFSKNYFLYLPFLNRLRGMVVITHKLEEFFVKNGIPKNKILVAPDGVDLEKFDIKENQEDCRRKLNLPLDKKIVLYTGHLYEWKGATTLAASSVSLDEDTFIIFVGGTKEDIERFKSEILNLKSKIWVVGHRPHSEIPYWLKAADVLVLPNSAKEEISKFWTSPIKMFEYMASQRPIISSDLPSIREILNGQNCIFCQPGDAEDLAKKIKQVLNNPTLGEKLAGQAYQDVLQYSWDKRARKILEFISG